MTTLTLTVGMTPIDLEVARDSINLIECELGQIDDFRIIESQLANPTSFGRSKLFDSPQPKGAQWKRERGGKSWK